MIIKYPVIYFCAIIVLLVGVDSQICERLESFTRMAQITYQTSYQTTYHGQCYYGCIKTRWSVSVQRRFQPKREWKSIRYCCSGYIRKDDSSNDSDIKCIPICMPACKNGLCESPGKCACDRGYIPDAEVNHNCLPVCEKGCVHGACVGPNICKCDFGYSLGNETCQPVCTEPCHNGTCVAPETCECLSGYRKSESNVCVPYCSNGCDNGYCAAPETCHCNPGWHQTESKGHPNKICKPFCSKPCDNGDCVAPETCKCWPSYKKSENGTCGPDCPSGWKAEDNKCVALCKNPCGNGTCVLPDYCMCFPGYHVDHMINRGINEEVCIPQCVGCLEKNGICVAPNQCVTEEVSTTSLENLCEEFQNCSTDTSNQDTTNQDSTSVTFSSETTDAYEDYNESDYSMGFSLPEPDFTSSNVSSKVADAPSGDTKAESMKNSWIQQNWVAIFIPLLIIVTAGIIMVLVWRWIPIIVFFKGRSYVVQGDPLDNNGSYPFEDIQISSTNVKETKEAKK